MVEQTVHFEQAFERAVGQLRAALIELFDSVGLDAASPPDLARRLRLNKTLVWNVSKLIQTRDHFGALPHIPGEQSLERLIDAAGRQGASEESQEQAREAVRAFHEMTVAHGGDRSSLDLMVDSMSPPASDAIDSGRRLAFRGNSALYGLQAKARLMSFLVAPNPQRPELLDVATLAGFSGLRRLRPDVRWPIFKLRSQSKVPFQVEDLWEGAGSEGRIAPPRCFSRGEPPDIRVVDSGVDRDFVLMPGSVGDTAAFDCFRGEFMRAAVPRHLPKSTETGEFGAAVTVPSENLVLDLIVHRDLEFVLSAEMLVFATIYSKGEGDRSTQDASLLPIKQEPAELVGRPLAVATPLVPRYSEFMRTMQERMGVAPEMLRGIRVEMKYPPLGSMVVLRYPIPQTERGV